jgi:hypothetical protein
MNAVSLMTSPADGFPTNDRQGFEIAPESGVGPASKVVFTCLRGQHRRPPDSALPVTATLRRPFAAFTEGVRASSFLVSNAAERVC